MFVLLLRVFYVYVGERFNRTDSVEQQISNQQVRPCTRSLRVSRSEKVGVGEQTQERSLCVRLIDRRSLSIQRIEFDQAICRPAGSLNANRAQIARYNRLLES